MPKLKVPGVKAYVSKGRPYAYDRISGKRLTPPHTLYSPEWFEALRQARASAQAAPKERPGTWGALVVEYRSSPRFKADIAPRTRADYQQILDWLKPLHDVPLPAWTRGFVVKLRDRAQKNKGRRFGNYVLSLVSIVFNFAVERELADANPAAGVKKVRRPKGQLRSNRPWSREEWNVVRAAAPPVLLAPILLGGVLGYREGEAISAKRDTWHSRSGSLSRVSAKSGKLVKVPAPAEVDAALRNLPRHSATTLLVNSRLRPWTLNGFRGSFFRLIRGLAAQGRVGPGLTFHGLRHTAATRMRELGFDTRTIADMLGQETEGMAGHYAREADLEPKLRGVVRRLDQENRKSTRMSNSRTKSV